MFFYFNGVFKIFLSVFMNPFVLITALALALQSAMLVLFYALPDPLGLSLTEMFSGKIVWQISMAFGGILVLSSIFAFLKKPRALIVFLMLYFLLAIADYEVFRFSHQRLSYSFLRTYFHISNIADETTISTLGGDLKGTVSWFVLILVDIIGGASLFVYYTLRKKDLSHLKRRVPVTMLTLGLVLSVIPLVLFLAGTRGVKTIPVLNAKVDMRFTLGKHTLTAPVLHIAAEETFEFIRDNHKITDELIQDLDAFLPAHFAASRISGSEKDFPAFRSGIPHEYKAQKKYNIVFIFGESFKGRFFNQMLEGDTALAPNLWKLASGGYYKSDSAGNISGGGLWFKNAFSGGYPTVRGTMATYMGFPSHPNRDVPSFYASNHFTGFPEYLTHYKKAYMTVSNPVFDHTLPFVEKFFGDCWKTTDKPLIEGTTDSLGVDLSIQMLREMPTMLPGDSAWFLAFNTIATHIPFRNVPVDFAPPSEDATERYRNALRYTDLQLGRFFKELSQREDFNQTVIVILGDHDTPVDSLDRKVPQPLGVSASQIFMGIFSPDTALFDSLEIRDDVASQLDIGPTIMDLAQVNAKNHFWGYDLLVEKRPAGQPALFFSENAYFLGFRDFVLTGGLQTEEIYKGSAAGEYHLVNDSLSKYWKNKSVGASKVLRSLLRNDNMQPETIE